MSRAAHELLRGSRMRAGVRGAAWLFGWLEFHQFDARFVRIVQVKLPFPVAANLRLFRALPAVFDELLPRRLNIWNAEGDMVHYAKRLMACVRRNIENVIDQVSTIRHLHIHPARL